MVRGAPTVRRKAFARVVSTFISSYASCTCMASHASDVSSHTFHSGSHALRDSVRSATAWIGGTSVSRAWRNSASGSARGSSRTSAGYGRPLASEACHTMASTADAEPTSCWPCTSASCASWTGHTLASRSCTVVPWDSVCTSRVCVSSASLCRSQRSPAPVER